MLTPAELALRQTSLGAEDIAHLQGLMAWWGMLADLSFSDLLLLAPAAFGDQDAAMPAEGKAPSFVVLGQVRPSTTQTLHREDLVGRLLGDDEWPLVVAAWRLGEIVDGEVDVAGGERARRQCIPVRRAGRLLAILARESSVAVRRRPGELERVYVELFGRFARMVTDGTFPFAGGVVESGEPPRVGDGAIVLDEGARVTYASPNAVSALHRIGVTSNAEGLTLAEMGIEETIVADAFRDGLPASAEVERRQDAVAQLLCIPLLASGRVSGALLLVRDVTDLRRRDRLLVSKDATIREIHHRVKNNLQTISSLLRLQARRLRSSEGRTALAEAERRIRSIAVVHEILSQDLGDDVPFDEIVGSLVRLVGDSAITGRAVALEVIGHAGELPAQVATPLAVAVTELLQNAIEHAFKPEATSGETAGVEARVRLELQRGDGDLTVVVSDNGSGLPEGFSVASTETLGLSIVRDIVVAQLGGAISMASRAGTVVELSLPLGPWTPARPEAEP